MENLILFPGTKAEALETVVEKQHENGVVISDNPNTSSGIEITIFGAPTRALLLWMSEQLRICALHDNPGAEEDEVP